MWGILTEVEKEDKKMEHKKKNVRKSKDYPRKIWYLNSRYWRKKKEQRRVNENISRKFPNWRTRVSILKRSIECSLQMAKYENTPR